MSLSVVTTLFLLLLLLFLLFSNRHSLLVGGEGKGGGGRAGVDESLPGLCCPRSPERSERFPCNLQSVELSSRPSRSLRIGSTKSQK